MDLSIEYLHVFLQLVFVLSGISKFVPDRRVIREHFPLLPSAFWIVAGSWELMMVALLWFQQDFVATVMIYVFMGGVFGASLLLKGDGGSTAAQKTYGLILIPVSRFMCCIFWCFLYFHNVHNCL